MSAIALIAGSGLVLLVLADAFEAMVLPRRVTRFFRPTRLFYRITWAAWRAVGVRLKAGRRREAFLSLFGPLSLLTLLATWALSLIVGFGLVQWSVHMAVRTSGEPAGLFTYLYLSGVTFFTLGYGDVTATHPAGRVLEVAEAGLGFGFMAVVIGYLPVLYQAFSRRELTISLMDARAGSPPTAAQFLLRLAQARQLHSADAFLAEWERWAAELLESHLSFPVLSYYRSQHDNQSWLAALTAMLDSCALLIVAVRDAPRFQAQLTFAMARHAAVDLALVFRTPPRPPEEDRLGGERWTRLSEALHEAELPLADGPTVTTKLCELRAMYEPFVAALGEHFLLAVPPAVPEKVGVDNWQTSAWMKRTPGLGGLPVTEGRDEHFK